MELFARARSHCFPLFHWRLDKYVSEIRKICYHEIRNMGKYFDDENTKLLINALVTSALDYGRVLQTFLSKGHTSYYAQYVGRTSLRNVIVSGYVTSIKSVNVSYIFPIFGKFCSWAGWNGFAGRIWHAGRSLETRGFTITRHTQNPPCQTGVIADGLAC